MDSLDELKPLIGSGDLEGALAATKKLVAKSPLDSGVRATLCALLFASGEPARAVQQFEAYRQLGGENLPADFASVLQVHEDRADVLRGIKPPTLANEPPAWLESHIKALAALAGGDPGPLLVSLEALSDSLLALKGETETVEFEGFRNADMRLAPVLEGVFEGEYTWLPFEQIKQLILPARPELIQDLIAIPCMVSMQDGWRSQGHLFGAYPDSHLAGSGKVSLSMETTWDETHEDLDLGLGQQILLAGEEPIPLFGLGMCRFHEDS